MSIDGVLLATPVFVLQQPPKLSLLYSLVILEMHADTGGAYTHVRGESVREYANENNSKEMLHYLRRLCDELYWQQHTVCTIYNIPFHLFFSYSLAVICVN